MGHVMGKLSDILSVDCRFPMNGDRESRILMLGLDAAGKHCLSFASQYDRKDFRKTNNNRLTARCRNSVYIISL